MKLKIGYFRTIVFVTALVTGLLIGTFSFAATNIHPNSGLQPSPAYNINEYGETYGSDLFATSIEATPDLILAVGVDGTTGYVRSTDLNGEMPKTPEEALEQQRNRPQTREIPLYDVDGRTVIGKFVVGGEDIQVIEFTESYLKSDY